MPATVMVSWTQALGPTVGRFLRLLGEHHPDTERHCRRVCLCALRLGEILGLPRCEQQVLSMAARLHDVGKLSLPAALLDKPEALTPEEYRRVQHHVVEGVRLLWPLTIVPGLLPAVRHHHERFDGTGYPDGLAGQHIPLLARILAIADCFDALTSSRPYRQPFAPADALAYLREGAGRQFDPHLVEAFIGRALPPKGEPHV